MNNEVLLGKLDNYIWDGLHTRLNYSVNTLTYKGEPYQSIYVRHGLKLPLNRYMSSLLRLVRGEYNGRP